MRLLSVARTLSHEMDVVRQKLRKNCDFEVSRATLSHEMDVGRQKLKGKIATLSCQSHGRWTSKTRKKCDFTQSIATLTREMVVGRQKTEEKMRFYLVNRNPFARNGR